MSARRESNAMFFSWLQSFLLKGEKYADVRKCADCGKTFINETFLKAHQEKRHPKRGTGGASEDVKHKITKEESMKVELSGTTTRKIGFYHFLLFFSLQFRSWRRQKMLRCRPPLPPPKSRPWPTNCWANSSNEICKKVLQAGRCHQPNERELKRGSYKKWQRDCERDQKKALTFSRMIQYFQFEILISFLTQFCRPLLLPYGIKIQVLEKLAMIQTFLPSWKFKWDIF